MEEAAKLQWEGKAKANLTNTTADQAWSLLKDFTNLHKILPTLHTCHLVEGVDGETGCIRYCAGAREDGVVMWAKERLIETDPVNRFNRYVVEENNMGFRRYFGRVGVVDGEGGGGGGGDGGGGEGGCVIEWSYVADPIDDNHLAGEVDDCGHPGLSMRTTRVQSQDGGRIRN
ncbi:Lachrymatory-factor synthase [Acorus gramineus]|uniref:Lachrymatory-factor synthase n=1 Tax=Acorus gramineus TaxID=55184 RepID=A0AAV9ATR6_ACOGR|nr:Lachrymatory-factor synthase [Acorus gramineus]